nr:hypothetical protein [Hydrogenophaga crassostreae]
MHRIGSRGAFPGYRDHTVADSGVHHVAIGNHHTRGKYVVAQAFEFVVGVGGNYLIALALACGVKVEPFAGHIKAVEPDQTFAAGLAGVIGNAFVIELLEVEPNVGLLIFADGVEMNPGLGVVEAVNRAQAVSTGAIAIEGRAFVSKLLHIGDDIGLLGLARCVEMGRRLRVVEAVNGHSGSRFEHGLLRQHHPGYSGRFFCLQFIGVDISALLQHDIDLLRREFAFEHGLRRVASRPAAAGA